jgi:peptide/nickel transport system substrate-binding protein
MKSKIMWLILSCLLVLSLVLASCDGTKTTKTTSTTVPTTKPTTTLTTTPATKPTTTPTTTTGGKWWDKYGIPQYGGTITFRNNRDPVNFDVAAPTATGADQLALWLETLSNPDMSTDPNLWEMKTTYCPIEYRKGLLAESWEQPDAQTIIFHIRKGIKWQDKAPVNGREFTAYDVEYHYNRIFGLGKYGFTTPTPYGKAETSFALLTSVTATDKYTVVFKWKEQSPDMLYGLIDTPAISNIVPREPVDLYGSMQDWKRAVGTGPWILDDYVSGSSLSMIRNPNYWQYDDRYPQNQLPYADKLKMLIIPDDATALAALRTGKIEVMRDIGWEKAKSLAQTNPMLLQATLPATGPSLEFRVDKAPFTDLRVRTALQMAIDLKEIATSYYGGTVDSTPVGLVHPVIKDYYTPFDQWPKEVQAGYTYNPEGAKKLLAEAGFPNGFKTNLVVPTNQDLDLMQVIKAYFLKIGVDMEIRVMDATSFTAFTFAWKHDQISARTPGATGLAYDPNRLFTRRYSKHTVNLTQNNDAFYDGLYEKFTTSMDQAERTKLVKQAMMYAVAQHWAVNILPTVNYCIYQPWFKGFQGESTGVDYSRYWIDSGLKKSLGY